MRLSALASSLVVLAACSGNVTSTAHSGDAGSGGDSGTDAGTHPDGGGTCRTTAPTLHRPTAAACEAHVSDAGADTGVGPCMQPQDACLVDSDCGSTGVCDCETPRCTVPFPIAGNVCVPSDCRVDSDCACGYCAADTSCGGVDSYHCTTPRDECSTDADCQDSGSFTQCRWSTDHWACVQGMGCPG